MENLENSLKWTLISNLFNLSSGLIIILLISRILGPELYGQYETLIALIAVSVLILDFGLSPASARLIAKYKTDYALLKEILLLSTIIKLILLILFSLIFISNINLVNSIIVSINISDFLILSLLIFMMRTIYEFISRSLQGLSEIIVVAKANLIKTSFHLLGLILLFYFDFFNLKSVLIVEILSFFIINFYMTIKLLNANPKLINMKMKHIKILIKELLKNSFPLFVISVGFMLFNQSDILLLQHYFNSKIVALFAITLIIITKLQAPFTAIGFTFAPLFTTANREVKINLFEQILMRVLILNLPIVMILYFLAPDIVLIFFGDAYQESIPILKLMTLFFFFLSLNTVFTPIMDFLGYAKSRALFLIIAAIIKLILSLYLLTIFSYWGVILSTIFSYSLYSIIIQIYLGKKIYKNFNFRFLKSIISIVFKLIIAISISSLTLIILTAISEVNLVMLIFKLIISLTVYYYLVNKLLKIKFGNFLKFT